jgi:uroporphyrinogen III methyltransferase/synthase
LGIEFDEVAVYRNVEETHWDTTVVDRIAQGQVDWITLTSSGVVRSLAAHLPDQARTQLGRRTKLASISPVTTQTARELGLQIAVEAATASMDTLVEGIVEQVRNERRATNVRQATSRHTS